MAVMNVIVCELVSVKLNIVMERHDVGPMIL